MIHRCMIISSDVRADSNRYKSILYMYDYVDHHVTYVILLKLPLVNNLFLYGRYTILSCLVLHFGNYPQLNIYCH